MKLKQLALALCCSSISFARYATHVPRSNSGALTVRNGYKTVLDKSQIVVGNSNTTVKPVTGNEAKIDTKLIAPLGGEPTTIRVDVESKFDFVGVKFNADDDDTFYGVWEYPWGDNLDDNGIMFDLKGVGNSDGVNWDNARAPFFFSTAGYGVYADTLAMGSYNFKSAGEAEFIFNTSSLTYYIIFPEKDGDYKSIIQQYVAGLSETITMPPDSGYGPTFWSDNFEQDFHGDVKNAQENYFDVVNHLYDYQIHASSMFADRPYGTGNMSFGNFDFDPAFYPTPEEFIANLSRSGYDFQVCYAIVNISLM